MAQKRILFIVVSILSLITAFLLGLTANSNSSIFSDNTVGGYHFTDGVVHFFNQPMFEADPQTFTPLLYDYAVDKNYVFYDGRIIPGADPTSFSVMGFLMAKDNFGVYTFDRNETLLDPKRIDFLGNFYSVQDGQVFYKGTPIDADAGSFETLPEESAGKDKNYYYLRGRIDETKN